MLLTGSRRIKEIYPDFYRNIDNSDYDYLVKKDSITKELLDFLKLNHNLDIHQFPINLIQHKLEDGKISMNLMLTIKVSHIIYETNKNRFNKTLNDIRFLLQKGHSLYYEILGVLRLYWDKIRQPFSMNVDNKDFFKDYVDRKYDHDDLHKILKNPPTYNKIKKDITKAKVNEDLWNTLSILDKDNIILEEFAVLMNERYKENHSYKMYKDVSRKMIIRLLPDYIAIYFVLNYNKLLNKGIKTCKTLKKLISY